MRRLINLLSGDDVIPFLITVNAGCGLIALMILAFGMGC